MMTLEEAIDHYLERESKFRTMGLELCAQEHTQLRVWLEELKDRRRSMTVVASPGSIDPGGLY